MDNSLLIRALTAWNASRADPERAESAARAVIAECGAGDAEALVVGLRTCGWLARIRFEHERALETLAEAYRIAVRHGLRHRAADVLITRAGVHLETGRSGHARRDLVRARTLLDGAPSAALENQFGVLSAKVGNPAVAARHFQAAVDAATGESDPVVLFMALNNLGLNLTSLGRADEAVATLVAAEAVADQVGDFARGATIQSLAVALVAAGRLPDALREFGRAGRVLHDSGWPAGEAYLERIEVLAGLRLMREADRAASEAVRNLPGPGGAMLRADVSLAHARVLLASGRLEESAEAATTAHDLYRDQRRATLAAAALVVTVRADLARGLVQDGSAARVARAAPRLERAGWVEHAADAFLCVAEIAGLRGRRARERDALAAVVRLTRDGPTLLRLRGAVAEARAAESSEAVVTATRRGLAELARFRATLPTPELRALASGHGRELAAIGLRAAVAGKRPGVVLEWMELGRMASSLVHAPLPQDDVVDDALARLREIHAARRAPDADVDSPGALRIAEGRLERRIQRRLRSLRVDGVTIDESPSAGTVLQALEPSACLVSMADCDGRLHAVVARDGTLSAHDLGASDRYRTATDQLLFGLRRIMRARSAASAAAARAGVEASLREFDGRLSDVLGHRLAGSSHVIVAPPPALLPAPWHALSGIGADVVSVVPSVALFLHRRAANRPPGDVVVVAGPDLPGALTEATRLRRIHSNARVLRTPKANVRAVVDALEGAQLAHLACHGRLRTDNPSFSSLRLSDGDLTMLDIERLNSPPRVMVLSACDVGAATTLPGDELRGFLSAALTIGTRAVVASAVPVHDLATADLMAAFHRGLVAGRSVGVALREAQSACDDGSAGALVGRLAFACYGDATTVVASAP